MSSAPMLLLSLLLLFMLLVMIVIFVVVGAVCDSTMHMCVCCNFGNCRPATITTPFGCCCRRHRMDINEAARPITRWFLVCGERHHTNCALCDARNRLHTSDSNNNNNNNFFSDEAYAPITGSFRRPTEAGETQRTREDDCWWSSCTRRCFDGSLATLSASVRSRRVSAGVVQNVQGDLASITASSIAPLDCVY